ncbi:MAG TPA: RNA polymerase sigma factor [Aromatoleum sp.]|uniref:RNA polymerase sigma factor n=1 Tax=Aromatoleum sp. TaxID=2307007 RepID=UPI002B486E3F|nr:RNA polymerase sigma factor [Aromatoleum sp.]HJV28827.1 RNA polymerase sigma factor [Aromatoleum sp.]
MSPSDAAIAQTEPGTDTALVDRILAGDVLAFERMMRLHNRRLFRVARSILRDDAEAEDAVQDGYIEAHRALAGFRGEAKLSTWLTRIIVNQALARRRRPHMPVATEEELDTLAKGDGDVPPETPETLAMRAELRRLIEASIDGLPDAYRTVFMLRAVEGLSVEETAATLGISSGNTKVRFLRARGQLRNALGARLGSLLEDVFAFDGARCDRIVAQVCARLGLPAPSLPAVGESNPT